VIVEINSLLVVYITGSFLLILIKSCEEFLSFILLLLRGTEFKFPLSISFNKFPNVTDDA
jgi:hypothetical protein